MDRTGIKRRQERDYELFLPYMQTYTRSETNTPTWRKKCLLYYLLHFSFKNLPDWGGGGVGGEKMAEGEGAKQKAWKLPSPTNWPHHTAKEQADGYKTYLEGIPWGLTVHLIHSDDCAGKGKIYTLSVLPFLSPVSRPK